MAAEPIDVILRLQNLRAFVAGTQEAAASVREVGAASKEANAEASLSGGMGKQAGVLGLVGKAGKVGAAGLAVMAVEGSKLSIDFQKQMEMIHTQAGVPQAAIAGLSKSIMGMAKSGQYAQGPEELAKGLYHLTSVGMKPAQALDALKVSAQGAAVGGAQLEQTTSALGAAWLANIKGAGTFNHVMAIANATVGAGNMRMEDLVQAMGTGILPSAKNAGLGIKDVMGALALLSDEGYKGSSAMAQMATALHFLYNPTTKAEKALSSLHLSGTKMYNIMSKQGLPAALKTLHDRLQSIADPAKRAQVLGQIFPGGRGRVMVTLLNQYDRYQKKINQITGTTSRFGDAVAKTHETAAFKIHAAWSQVQASLIQFGNVMRPVAVIAVQAFALLVAVVVKVVSALMSFGGVWRGLPGPIRAVLTIIGLMVAQAMALYLAFRLWGLLVAVFRAVSVGIMIVRGAIILLQMGSGPLMIALMALIAVVILLVTHWKQVKAVLASVWNWMKGAALTVVHAVVAAWHWLMNGISSVISTIVNFIKKHWKLIVGIMIGPIGLIIIYIISHFNQVIHFISGLPGKIAKAASGMWDGIKNAFKTAINWVITAWDSLHFSIGGWHLGTSIAGHHIGVTIPKVTIGMPHIPTLATGGVALGTGMALVGEAGPELMNLPRAASIRPLTPSEKRPPVSIDQDVANRIQHTTIIQVDRREIARATSRFTDDKMARQ